MLSAIIHYTDGSGDIVSLVEKQTDDALVITLDRDRIVKPAEYVDLMPDLCMAEEGSEGYFTFGNNLTYFRDHEDGLCDCGYGIMRYFGAKTKDKCIVVIATGLWEQHHVIIEKANGRYRIYMRFMLDGCTAEEDIQVKIIPLSGDDADYSGMARAYRREAEKDSSLRTLRDRANEHLRYVMDAPEIRIRMGWKPVPSPVLEQTRENEPPMRAACTFDDVISIMKACRREGVDKAEFCLVGWNVKGHDGRWPEAFPIEEALGGGEGLKRTIACAKELGYKLVCHTNVTDCYSIADVFHDELPMRTRDGKWASHDCWSGGRMYDICPVCGERYSAETIKKCAELGFSGLHYVDVITTVPPRRCFSEKHPCSQREYIRKMRDIARLSRECIGGFQSEGGYDYLASSTDMGLYVDFHMTDKANPFCDGNVPLWQIVYHDHILANPGTVTVNYPAKGWFSRLKFLEFGGYPVLYIYSRFREGFHWMGEEDFTADSEAALLRTAKAIRMLQDDYRMTAPVRHIAMIRHEVIAGTLHVSTYENGYRMICNYGDSDAVFEGAVVPAHDAVLTE